MPAHALEVTGFRVEASDGGERVSLRLTAKAQARVFAVEDGPPRVVVDLPTARWRGAIVLPADYRGGLIKGVRFGYHDATTSRLVLDLNAQAKPGNVKLIGSRETGAFWLEFDLASGFAPRRSKHAANDPRHTTSEKPVIVIDAGHGGKDSGTIGPDGTEEKDIALAYAHALMDALLRTGHFKVALTREDDRFLLLRDRVKVARAAHGELFISLHVNSAPQRSASGLSVYTISETASDKEAGALAAKENKADVIGGMDLSDTSQDVADILIDLANRETRAKSAQFADLAVRELGREVSLLSNSHRFAGFAVLKAPDIPSVLIELGFITNPHEERELRSAAYRARIARGVTKAVEDYFGRRK